MATENEWGWFTGLFEGEGCISFVGVNSVLLVIVSTDHDVLVRAYEIAGVGKIVDVSREKTPSHWKQRWQWSVGRSADVQMVLERMQPYLLSRRLARLEEARQRLSNVRQHGYCKRGHPMDGENLYVSPGGQRICRACAKQRDEKRKGR